MSCYCPCFVRYYVDRVTGELKSQFLGSSWNKDLLSKKYDGVDHTNYFLPGNMKDSIVQIPCGKCIGCRIDYKRSWADRLTYHSFGKEENSYFITLTYDDEHIEDLEHSPIYDLYALNFNHMTAFIKNLRAKFPGVDIDYYYSGEYGDNSFRPHFHLIVFNLPLDDLEFWKLDNEGAPIYTSELIHKIWKKGICSISSFAWLNAAYTAGYVEKKRDGRALCEYTAVGLTPEACRMSRRPGLAFDYYVNHYQDIWNNNGLSVSRDINSSGKLGIPRYFRKLATDGYIDKDTGKRVVNGHKEFLAWQQRNHEKSLITNPIKLQQSSFDLGRVRELLQFEERNILSRQENRKL